VGGGELGRGAKDKVSEAEDWVPGSLRLLTEFEGRNSNACFPPPPPTSSVTLNALLLRASVSSSVKEEY
jgi:hypothetical protein